MKERYYSLSLLRSLAYDDDVNGNCDGMIDFTVVDSIGGADVEKVQHGKWIPTNIPSFFGGIIYECSLCSAKDGDHSSILGKYCWRCGAKMDGGKSND